MRNVVSKVAIAATSAALLAGCATTTVASPSIPQLELRKHERFADNPRSANWIWAPDSSIPARENQNQPLLQQLYHHSTRAIFDWEVECDSDQQGRLSRCILFQPALYSRAERRAILRFVGARHVIRPPELSGPGIVRYAASFRISAVGARPLVSDCRTPTMCGVVSVMPPPPPPPTAPAGMPSVDDGAVVIPGGPKE